MHPPTNYNSPPLAKFFHALPHINISLHLVNSTFAPDSDVYLESLGILGSIPALWLIFTLLLLLLYLCTRCCDRKPRPKHSIVILKWTLSFFTMFCCGAVGVGLYGNDDVHNGMLELLTAGRAMHETISSVKNQTLAIDSTLTLKVKRLLTQLGDVFDEPVSNQTARAVLLRVLEEMTSNTSVALASLQDISRPLNPVTLAPALDTLQKAEDIRWPVTMVVLSILLVFCVILLFGVARHSRCALITFSVFGLFAVIFSWLMASLYLTASVALGDLCETPMVLIKLEAPAPLHHDYLNYYMTCEHGDQNPFWVILLKASKAISNVTDGVNSMTRIARQLYKPHQLHPKLDMLAKEIKLASNLINSLTTKLDCTQIHNQYMAGLHAVCEMALFGLTFMLAASVGAGFLFAILVWLDSHTWIYIRKKREYLQVDEQDPFLPPTAASQAIAARTLHGQGSYGTPFPFSHTHAQTPPYLNTGLHGAGPGGICDRSGVSQYATLNRKFRTLEHPSASRRGDIGMTGRRSEAGNSYTLGSRKSRSDGPGQYNTLSKKCKTLESSDFY
ncbi:protein tweety isoform X1 [Cimex lectularius]|uniref:Protein tweety homolog n=1 Tax=Cimex lectularius TaxID=79782 RepID=A0A8I6RD37_CIMLE|nr:protein tweety isoform X1 [Cimex lectularius]XP_014242980.1 protein tweety isoform X1 [Cimex lectularius]XP_014242989.1 protein tweety isoform X1 [Cimex lectularius]